MPKFRNLAFAASMLALAGCSFEMPGFLGREGSGDAGYTLRRGPEPLPDPVPIAIQGAAGDPAPGGVILRVDGLAPAQGYHTAALIPRGVGANGIAELELVAIPPEAVLAVGPPQTRELQAALFLPSRQVEDLRSVQIVGSSSSVAVALP